MQNTQKTRYSEAELAEFKKIILEKLETANGELAYLRSSLKSPHESSNKLGEAAVSNLEKEELTQLASRQQKFIGSLEAALVRIGNKTYGICHQTNQLIPKERLRAVPHTTLCMGAKNAPNAA